MTAAPTGAVPRTASRTVASAINGALHAIFETDERVHLVGEDLLDPYGGAFKISRGLSERWPGRVHTTPISEAAVVGICGGMALRGLRPVAEIMFGDFIALAFDQILNHVSKFGAMYNGRVRCPVTIRTPMGGGRGYGPTHSQSLEKFLVGVPGLDVIAVSHVHDIDAMYRAAICESNGPSVVIENKLLYGAEACEATGDRAGDFAVERAAGPYGTVALSLAGFRRTDVTVITYGGMARLAMETARRMLIEHEIVVDVLVTGRLSPVPLDELLPHVRRSRRAVTLEEGTMRLGIGAEIAGLLSEHLWGVLAAPVLRVAALDDVVPAAKHLEEHMLPNGARLEAAILRATRI